MFSAKDLQKKWKNSINSVVENWRKGEKEKEKSGDGASWKTYIFCLKSSRNAN